MKIKKMLDTRRWMLVAAMAACLFIGASFPLQVGSAQFIDRIIRPCGSGIVPRAQVVANPNNTGNVQITTCTGGSVTINGTAIVPGGGTINATNTFIPYRLNATTFADSPLARTSATVITSTAAFNGPAGGVNTATYSFAAEPTLGWIRGAAGQLTATSGGTIGWFDTNGWHGFGTKVEVFNDTATSTDGFIATTNGNATVGVQKLSPRIRLSGSGWKTDAVAGAQMTDWIIENQSVQGTANPSTNLVFSSQVNAGGYTPGLTIGSAGYITAMNIAPGFALAADNYASLAAAVTAIGATPTTLVISTANFPSGASTTVPSTLILDFRGPGSLLLTAGHVVAIESDGYNWPIKKIFGNALAGQGTVTVTGRNFPQWWGALGDGATDNAAPFQAAIVASSLNRGWVMIPSSASQYLYSTSLDLTPGDVPLHNVTILGDGIGATVLKFTGTGYAIKAWDTAGTPGLLDNLTLGRMSLVLGTSGTGLLQIGRLAHTYDVTIFRNNHRYYDLALTGDVTGGNWRAGTIGMLTKQLGSCVFDNVTVHNFETAWIQDTHTECQYNKMEFATFNNGVDIRGQTAGADTSTFVQPAFHGPHGTAVNGFGLKVNAGHITLINAIYEPNGTFSGSGNTLLWLGQYSAQFADYNGVLAISAAATSFTNTLLVDAGLVQGYTMNGTSITDTGAPGITINAPSANAGSTGRFLGCQNQLRTLIRATAANIGRYSWVGPCGTGEEWCMEAAGSVINITGSATMSDASATNVTPLALHNTDITSNTTRTISLDFVGRDTVGNPKTLTTIRSTIDEINGNDAHLTFYTRTGGTLTPWWNLGSTGSLTAVTNNAYDIGAPAFAPRTGYFGTSINSPTYLTTTNCADSAGAAACGSAAAGAVVIDAGNTSVVVSTTAVTATSRMMVVFDSSLGAELGVTCNITAALPFVTARTAATSFTISVGVAPAVNPGCFSYWIVN